MDLKYHPIVVSVALNANISLEIPRHFIAVWSLGLLFLLSISSKYESFNDEVHSLHLLLHLSLSVFYCKINVLRNVKLIIFEIQYASYVVNHMYLNVQIEIVTNEQDRPRFLLIYYSTEGLTALRFRAKQTEFHTRRVNPPVFLWINRIFKEEKKMK